MNEVRGKRKKSLRVFQNSKNKKIKMNEDEIRSRRSSKKSRAYAILKANGTLDRIRAQLQLAIFEGGEEELGGESDKRRPRVSHDEVRVVLGILNKYNLNATKTVLFKEIGMAQSDIEQKEQSTLPSNEEEEDAYSDDDFDEEEDGFSTPPEEVESSMEENINDLTKQEEDLSSFLSENTSTTINTTSSFPLLLREETLAAVPARLSTYDHVINQFSTN
jgi:hypothetical protein